MKPWEFEEAKLHVRQIADEEMKTGLKVEYMFSDTGHGALCITDPQTKKELQRCRSSDEVMTFLSGYDAGMRRTEK